MWVVLWSQRSCARIIPAVEDPPRQKEQSRRMGLLVALGLALAVFLLDQGLKALVENSMSTGESHTVIPGLLSITYVRNDGGAFGILGGSQLLLLVGSIVAVGGVLLVPFAQQRPRPAPLACGPIPGGAAGQLPDRPTTRGRTGKSRVGE